MDTTDRHLDAAEAAATRSLACPVCGLVVCAPPDTATLEIECDCGATLRICPCGTVDPVKLSAPPCACCGGMG
jgi:hypothetical protein